MSEHTVQSHTDPTKTYTVTIPDDLLDPTSTAEPSCTCVGYGYRRTCSHIKEVLTKLNNLLLDDLYTLRDHAPTPHTCQSCGTILTGTHHNLALCPACTRKEALHHA